MRKVLIEREVSETITTEEIIKLLEEDFDDYMLYYFAKMSETPVFFLKVTAGKYGFKNLFFHNFSFTAFTLRESLKSAFEDHDSVKGNRKFFLITREEFNAKFK